MSSHCWKENFFYLPPDPSILIGLECPSSSLSVVSASQNVSTWQWQPFKIKWMQGGILWEVERWELGRARLLWSFSLFMTSFFISFHVFKGPLFLFLLFFVTFKFGKSIAIRIQTRIVRVEGKDTDLYTTTMIRLSHSKFLQLLTSPYWEEM